MGITKHFICVLSRFPLRGIKYSVSSVFMALTGQTPLALRRKWPCNKQRGRCMLAYFAPLGRPVRVLVRRKQRAAAHTGSIRAGWYFPAGGWSA